MAQKCVHVDCGSLGSLYLAPYLNEPLVVCAECRTELDKRLVEVTRELTPIDAAARTDSAVETSVEAVQVIK